jgi:hypothetical protein
MAAQGQAPATQFQQQHLPHQQHPSLLQAQEAAPSTTIVGGSLHTICIPIAVEFCSSWLLFGTQSLLVTNTTPTDFCTLYQQEKTAGWSAYTNHMPALMRIVWPIC